MSVDTEGSEPLLSSHRVLVLEGSTSPPAQVTRESPFSNRVCSVSNGSVDLLQSEFVWGVVCDVCVSECVYVCREVLVQCVMCVECKMWCVVYVVWCGVDMWCVV